MVHVKDQKLLRNPITELQVGGPYGLTHVNDVCFPSCTIRYRRKSFILKEMLKHYLPNHLFDFKLFELRI